MIVDGEEGAAYDNVHRVIFSAQGDRFAYVGVQNSRRCAVLDGVEGTWYAGTGEAFVFSPCGTHFAYVVQQGNRWLVVQDGQEGPRFDGILRGGPVFSADGIHCAYLGRLHNQVWLVIDGHEVGPWDRNVQGAEPRFVDSQTLRFVAHKGDALYLVECQLGASETMATSIGAPSSLSTPSLPEIILTWPQVKALSLVPVVLQYDDDIEVSFGPFPSLKELQSQVAQTTVPFQRFTVDSTNAIEWTSRDPSLQDPRHLAECLEQLQSKGLVECDSKYDPGDDVATNRYALTTLGAYACVQLAEKIRQAQAEMRTPPNS